MEPLVYNPDVDLHDVDQFGFVDLRKAYDSGVIDGSMSLNDIEFNEVNDPSVLMHKPLDTFEAMRQAEYVRTNIKNAKNDDVAKLAQKGVEGSVTS